MLGKLLSTIFLMFPSGILNQLLLILLYPNSTSRFNELKQKYFNFSNMCTDGSKIETKVASVYVRPYATRDYRLRNCCSIFIAEVGAIEYVKVSTKKRFVIFSDNMSVLQTIESQQSKNTLINRVLQTCHESSFTNRYYILLDPESHRYMYHRK